MSHKEALNTEWDRVWVDWIVNLFHYSIELHLALYLAPLLASPLIGFYFYEKSYWIGLDF